MENKAEKEMNWKEKAMIQTTVGCFLGVVLMQLASGVFKWGSLRKQRDAQYQAQEDAHEMLREPRRILEETLKVFAEISKSLAAATIPSSPPDSAVGMETDSAQETAGMNPDAIDSVPCCGALTELLPVEMAMGKTSGNVRKHRVRGKTS